MMTRRHLLAGIGSAVAFWPFAGRAQTQVRKSVGIIFGGFSDADPELVARVGAFKGAMLANGWIEGQNVIYDIKIGAGDSARLQELARQLIASRPDLIIANSTAAARTLARDTRTIPIIFVNVTDPVETGLVKSLSNPQQNATGFASFEPAMVSKWMELLLELSPDLQRIAFISDQPNSNFLSAGQKLSPTSRASLAFAAVKDIDALVQFVESFRSSAKNGLIFAPSAITTAHRERLLQLVTRLQMPAIYPFSHFVDAGGLASYGVDVVDMFRRAADYSNRVLRGAHVGELPVQQPTKFELVLNLRAAKAINLAVSASLLTRADRVID
jgi:putative ABC transport system substrate-binding protein